MEIKNMRITNLHKSSSSVLILTALIFFAFTLPASPIKIEKSTDLPSTSYQPSQPNQFETPPPPQSTAPPHLWNTTWGDPFQSYASLYDFNFEVAVSGDDVFLTGTSRGATGLSEAFLACYNGSTSIQKWNTTISDYTNNINGYGLVTNGTTLFLSGTLFQGTTQFGDSSAFLGAFDPLDGTQLWNTTYNNTGSDFGAPGFIESVL